MFPLRQFNKNKSPANFSYLRGKLRQPLFLPLALPLPLLVLLLPLDTRGAISVECARAACIKFSLFTWKKTLNEEN